MVSNLWYEPDVPRPRNQLKGMMILQNAHCLGWEETKGHYTYWRRDCVQIKNPSLVSKLHRGFKRPEVFLCILGTTMFYTIRINTETNIRMAVDERTSELMARGVVITKLTQQG
jgi:hypothetical protein